MDPALQRGNLVVKEELFLRDNNIYHLKAAFTTMCLRLLDMSQFN